MSFPRQLGLQHRSATFTNKPADNQHRVIWTTAAQVRRVDFDGEEFDEILDLAGADLTRLNKGAPLLAAHDSSQLASVVGVVDKAWISGGRGLADIRISDRPEVAGIRRDVENGILRNLSVGYAINAVRIEKRKGRPDLVHVTRWEPLELSIVSIPADHGAQFVRSEFTGKQFHCNVHYAPNPTAGELQRRLLMQVAAGRA